MKIVVANLPLLQYTVAPPLSGRPPGIGKWLLINGGWPLTVETRYELA